VDEGQRTSRAGLVAPQLFDDIILFPSEHGDSEPIYLWRESYTSAAAGKGLDAEEIGDAALKALFV